jgi:hypothetical protein
VPGDADAGIRAPAASLPVLAALVEAAGYELASNDSENHARSRDIAARGTGRRGAALT